MRLTPLVNLLREFEGLRLHAYRDSVGVWTIGYGTTVYPDGKKVRSGDICTARQAYDFMMNDIETIRLPALRKCIKVALNDNEACALLSFAYNVGIGALAKSTLTKKLNAGVSRKEVAKEFAKWNKAGGKVLKGLTRRRAAEKALFLSSDLSLKLA